jgi:UDP-N-acetylglucosamine--N-acetylmuramyl-(pentapeptide) pyrophosphoryl-undecaprenol N-acetylglucosamine transferase
VTDGALRLTIAGGGTGGHVIPAIAVAEEVVRRGGEVRFAGTSDRIEARLVPEAGFEIDFIKARPLAGGGAGGLAVGLATTPVAVARSVGILRAFGPDVVLGVGGYVAGPVVLAAKLLGRPTALLEQNATVGLANRILARLVSRAFVTYEETRAAFPADRVELTGNPLRQSILEARDQAATRSTDGRVRILVMGGSQGALTIDQRVPEALARLADRVTVTHQCGGGREQSVERAYREAGIEARVLGFIDDTASAYLEADLVVARAGATTVCELTAMGLPAVFLPYPHHKDRQQQRNAAPMVDAGAAVVIDEQLTDAGDLGRAIAAFVTDDKLREEAAAASAALGRPDAATRIVDGLQRTVKGG